MFTVKLKIIQGGEEGSLEGYIPVFVLLFDRA